MALMLRYLVTLKSSIPEVVDVLHERKKVLVISDDPQLRGKLENNLPGASYQVASVQDSGEELKSVLGEILPDLIIVDIKMPWLDGIELCLRLRRWCGVPIIMLSSWDTTGDTVRALDLRARDYLTGPIPVSSLMRQIENTVYPN